MKRWIAMILAIIMTLSLCACTKTVDPNTTDNSTTGNTDPSGTDNNTEPSDVTDPTDADNFSLLTEATFRFIDGDETETMRVEFVYDDDHNITGCKVYEDSTLAWECTFNKDIRKPLIAQGQDQEGNKERQEYTYNENGDILTEHRYINDELDSKTKYTYDQDGNMLTERYYVGGELMTEAAFTYDEHGNPLTKYYDNGEEDWVDTYKNIYENGKLTEVRTYSSDTLDSLKQYDGDGNEILDVIYFDGEESSRTESTYENGKLVKIVDYDDGSENRLEEYTYNDSGKLLTRVISYSGVESYRMENIYDADGQLIEIKYLNDGSYPANTVIGYEDGKFVSVKLYDRGELEGDYTFTYEQATVSEKQAQTLTELYAMLLAECADL